MNTKVCRPCVDGDCPRCLDCPHECKLTPATNPQKCSECDGIGKLWDNKIDADYPTIPCPNPIHGTGVEPAPTTQQSEPSDFAADIDVRHTPSKETEQVEAILTRVFQRALIIGQDMNPNGELAKKMNPMRIPEATTAITELLREAEDYAAEGWGWVDEFCKSLGAKDVFEARERIKTLKGGK
ncbi:UNVERIFIED_ORG: hypothetical protein ABID57_000683 [Arthrobacter sp. UYEF1]